MWILLCFSCMKIGRSPRPKYMYQGCTSTSACILLLPVFTVLCLFLWIGKTIMMLFINQCPNYLRLLIWSMQTYIKTWWTLKCSHHTSIFDVRWLPTGMTGPICFEFFLFHGKRESRFPGEGIHGRNMQWLHKCSDQWD